MANPKIHGHEVIALLADANPPFNRTTLTAEVNQRWGPQVRFHTCSAVDLTLDQLLDFLLERGKLVTAGTGLSVVLGSICSDDV